MSNKDLPEINSGRIIKARGRKNSVDPAKPYGWIVEKERSHTGRIEDTAVVFLTNRECPFHCLMCDLWKNTLDCTIAPGLIPAQIEMALKEVGHAKHIKLYNSGSFFDTNAIPVQDYNSIASLLAGFETVIVESHPRFIDDHVLEFKGLLKPELHIAIGLEVADNEILQLLNKYMTLNDFEKATRFLSEYEIVSRAFILLRPPFLTEQEGIIWAKKSLDYAFEAGVECCTIIPVRGGNGVMEDLRAKGYFSPPRIRSLEEVLEYGIRLKKGRVFADTWDLKLFSDCDYCLGDRIERINQMNLTQEVSEKISCRVCGSDPRRLLVL